MLARSHVVIGAAAYSGICALAGQPAQPAGMAWAVLGSLLPDIDHPGSAIGRRLFFIARPLAAIIGHRGVTHSLLAIVVCAAALWLHGLAGAMIAPLAIGYLSHLFADALTPSGVPLLWPRKHRHTFPLTMATGSLWEYLTVGALAWAAAELNGVRMPRQWFRALESLAL